MSLPPILSNLRIPVVAAPLFIISHPALVIAQCKAGVVGSFPALNARPASQLDEWLHEISEALAKHDAENPDSSVGAVCGQPDRPSFEHKVRGGHGDLRKA